MTMITSLKVYSVLIVIVLNCVSLSCSYYLEISKSQPNSDICSKECIKKVALSSNNVSEFFYNFYLFNSVYL